MTIREKLPKAPLKEVIFEIHWQLEVNKQGLKYDPFYEFGKGIFYDRIKSRFPVKKDIPYPRAQNIRIIESPLHQFWSSELSYPVIQIGEGILTINDTDKNYKWEDTYKGNIEFALKCLFGSNLDHVFPFNKLVLKYMDAVDITHDDSTNLYDFIGKNLRVELRNAFKISGKNKALNIVQTFTMEDDSELLLSISSGKNNKTLQPAIVWNTGIAKIGKFDRNQILPWAELAHDRISNLFHSMLDQDFYASFK